MTHEADSLSSISSKDLRKASSCFISETPLQVCQTPRNMCAYVTKLSEGLSRKLMRRS
jgi:hypothetical protein